MNVRGVGRGSLTEKQHCSTCTTRLKRKENATSTSHDGTIHSSCLMTGSVDCVTTRPKLLRNSNCTRDRTTLNRNDLSRPAMSAWRVSKRATPEGEASSARDSKLPKSGGKGSMRASARRFARNVDRRPAKTEPQTRPGNPSARWGANRLQARAQNPLEGKGTGWERHTRTCRRRSWRHSQLRQRRRPSKC